MLDYVYMLGAIVIASGHNPYLGYAWEAMWFIQVNWLVDVRRQPDGVMASHE